MRSANSYRLPPINFSFINKTRGSVPRIPFGQIKNAVLGKRYDLSLAFVTPQIARTITRKTKKKNKPSNVLAFPLSPASGEIMLCPATARREAASYGKAYEEFLAYLFIHGCLHLAGYRHGATMSKAEGRVVKRFGL